MLRDLKDVIKSQLGVDELQIANTEEEGFDSFQQRDSASPAKPQIVFLTESPVKSGEAAMAATT